MSRVDAADNQNVRKLLLSSLMLEETIERYCGSRCDSTKPPALLAEDHTGVWDREEGSVTSFGRVPGRSVGRRLESSPLSK